MAAVPTSAEDGGTPKRAPNAPCRPKRQLNAETASSPRDLDSKRPRNGQTHSSPDGPVQSPIAERLRHEDLAEDALRQLRHAKDQTLVTKLVEEGVVESVVHAMGSPRRGPIMRSACAALASMAACGVHNKRMMEAGVIKAVIDAMAASDDPKLHSAGARALGNVARGCVAAKLRIRDDGGFKVVINACCIHKAWANVAIASCMALCNFLSGHLACHDQFVQDNGVEVVVMTLGSHRGLASVASVALRCLCNAIGPREDSLRRLLAVGGAEIVTRALSLHVTNPDVERPGCAALGRIASTAPVAAIAAGALDVAGSTLDESTDSASLAAACMALRRLAAYAPARAAVRGRCGRRALCLEKDGNTSPELRTQVCLVFLSWVDAMQASLLLGMFVEGRNGLPLALVEQLPRFVATEAPAGSHLGDCVICLEAMAAGRRLLVLPCLHVLHEVGSELNSSDSGRAGVCRGVAATAGFVSKLSCRRCIACVAWRLARDLEPGGAPSGKAGGQGQLIPENPKALLVVFQGITGTLNGKIML